MATAGAAPPLTPAVFHILLALAGRDRHGYAIMQQVAADTHGQVSMGNGTLYGSLKRMLEAGLVAESARRVDPAMDDQRRIYYRLTERGTAVLAAELERYRRIVALAQDRKLYPQTFTHAP